MRRFLKYSLLLILQRSFASGTDSFQSAGSSGVAPEGARDRRASPDVGLRDSTTAEPSSLEEPQRTQTPPPLAFHPQTGSALGAAGNPVEAELVTPAKQSAGGGGGIGGQDVGKVNLFPSTPQTTGERSESKSRSQRYIRIPPCCGFRK